ncbi:hypothetical protein JCGZ_20826 [Jatropha curcas]|uniref:Cysteine proteinase inhibitor n=1 Tax=Jatropha curcas TaxID=180498 RepID=A0A067K500_JATCU|nr:hypothetical protein JCGZ_20826 [Jatropha curcas]
MAYVYLFIGLLTVWLISLNGQVQGKIYRHFFLVLGAIDAVDNGINQYDPNQAPRYVNNTSLSNRVGKLNLNFTDPDQSSQRENEAFKHAMELAGSEFLEWKLHIFELEEEMKIYPSIKYVIYQDDRSENWRLQVIRIHHHSSLDRKEAW